MSSKTKGTTASASSNWLALQKKITATSSSTNSHPRKKRKIQHESNRAASTSTTATTEAHETTGASFSASFPRGAGEFTAPASTSRAPRVDVIKNGESVEALRKMVLGESKHTPNHTRTNKYISLDCEMVGVGLDGSESSLARVSIVNYYGEVLLDEFVQQRERVVDYRTQYSGIRPSDMVRAKPFFEIQQQVAELLKDTILVGHAVHNDMKALLLSHPYYLTRDTQVLAGRHKLTNSKRPALRVLVQQELDIAIQSGEHSSVVDARATMAIFRLHRKLWEKDLPRSHFLSASRQKRPAPEEDEDSEEEEEGSSTEATNHPKKPRAAHKKEFPGGGRRGVSSGLSTVIKRKDAPGKSSKSAWWKDLNG